MSVQQAVRPAPRQRSRAQGFFQREGVVGGLFVAPAVILIVAIAFWPIVQAIWYSLLSYLPNYPQFGSKFVGLDNYVAAFKDSTFISSIGNTLIFFVVTVVFEFVLGLLFALVLNQKFAGRGLARAAVLVPWAFPTVVSAVVWRDLVWRNNTGVAPALLHSLGLVPANWAPLADNTTLMGAMMTIDIWKTTPFMALLLLAGLQTIPDDVYEAARVDGANVWQRFFRITLPLLKPSILVALLFRALDAWRVFDMFAVVAGSRLQSISYYAYNQIINNQINYPVGQAVAVMIVIGALLISFIFAKGLGTQTAS